MLSAAHFCYMDYLIKALATWRLTKMIMSEDGPYEVFPKLNHALGVRYNENNIKFGINEAGNMMVCKLCLSFWVGLLFTLLPKVFAMPFAFSAAMIWLDKYYGKS